MSGDHRSVRPTVDDDELRASKRTVAMRWYEWTVLEQNQPLAMIGEWRASKRDQP
jgi:hypothetical protein